MTSKPPPGRPELPIRDRAARAPAAVRDAGEDRLDEEIEESFPASDPPASSSPVEHMGTPAPARHPGRGM